MTNKRWLVSVIAIQLSTVLAACTTLSDSATLVGATPSSTGMAALVLTSPVPSFTPSPSIIPSPMVTSSPIPLPTPDDCGLGFMIVNTEKGLDLTCADGSFSQQIISRTTIFPDGNWTIDEIAVSSDGHYLALSAQDSSLGDKRICVIDLSDYTTKTVYSFKSPHLDIHLSPDGEYIGYVIGREEDNSSQIEFVHLASSIVSQVITPEMIIPGGQANVGFNDFDWSPDGTQISYVVWDDRTPQYESYTGYIADVVCDAQTHICKASHPRVLPEVQSLCKMAWSFHDSNIVTSCRMEDGEEFTEIRTSDYRLVQRLTLDGFYDASLSPDGNHMAMYSTSERELYMLRLDDMTKFLLTDADHGYIGPFIWLP